MFATHILVPFAENGRTFYRDQNGYKWEEEDEDTMIEPVFTLDVEENDMS